MSRSNKGTKEYICISAELLSGGRKLYVGNYCHAAFNRSTAEGFLAFHDIYFM